jgi:hypothetical protein
MMTTYILVRPIVRADLLLRGPQQILTRRDSVTAQASVGKVSCQKHLESNGCAACAVHGGKEPGQD